MSAIAIADGATARNEPGAADAALSALHGAMIQMDELLSLISDEQFRTRPVGAWKCSIGEQVRHCLDHVSSLVAAFETGRIDYDQRDRGTNIEVDRGAARRQLARLAAMLTTGPVGVCARVLRLTARLSPAGEPILFDTTVGREVAFVQSHTVHHQAMIGAMAATLGVAPAADFGVAPATLAYRNGAACAQSPSSR